MPKKITPKILLQFLKITFCFSLFLSCSTDETLETIAENTPQKTNNTGKALYYKGVFATANSQFRGVFDLNLPEGMQDLNKLNSSATGKIKLHTGEVFEAMATEMRSKASESDFKVFFDSEDLQFTFMLDENDQPLIQDVVYKNQQGAIVAAEETEENPVTPVTGTYKCTNCENQNTDVNGIALNNNERTFNMLLTTRDGGTSLTIQTIVGMLVNTELLVNETCNTVDGITYCTIKGGEGLTREPLTWTGVHKYSEDGSNDCGSISGTFQYDSAELGAIKGEFQSDNSCPTSYFVSPAGNDENTGLSPQDAWRSINKLNNTTILPDTKIFLEGNQDHEGNLYLDSKDANDPARPVIISSYGNGKARIKAGLEYGIYAYNTSGIKINNLIVAGSGMESNQNSGIYFYNDLPGNTKLGFVEITNSEVHGFRDNGIVIGAWNANSKNSGFKDVLIENNKVYNILDNGIQSFGYFSSTKTGYAHSNIIVRNCEVFNIKGYSKNQHSGNGILLSDVQNSVIEYSTVYNSGSGNTFTQGGPVGIWYWDADQVTIQFNEVYGMGSASNKDGGGFDMDGGVTNGIMQYNYSHDNDGAGYLIGQFTGARPMQNIIVRYNISENDAATNGGSVYLFNGANVAMKDIYVYNNTFYIKEQSSNKASAAVKYITWKPVKDNINFYNNILFAENGADLINIPAGYKGYFAGNIYHTTDTFSINYDGKVYNSLEDFRTSGNEIYKNTAVGLQEDPLLSSPGNGGIIGFGKSLPNLTAYKLKSGSPAIDSGILIDLDLGEIDFYGTALTNYVEPDIGAHEEVTSKRSQPVATK
ncbi:right-handed parallel beta-helix repeat-containing protein [Antarcticibacterium flavum]|uniref:Right-handed parallel beta-helix repeat-containing protein n=1 Tax=Antarcticibacterium flavum TaxID=2058175 RepID=A0A5B7X0V5_9FLAO|nr:MULTISPECIES: right-handed parallel beta-helix repeat-containing protein [Antarcticibacterium]MCM4160409.1 hypothetical protein [Antarcticibacterium sp. W02-3]QCY69156.1 right-handed parallel beta-helix repeat-containing protein [Antarcticibacterium flavum]